MAHVKIQYDVMDAFCMDVFQRFGFTKEESRIIDERVALKNGVIGQETTGVGGFAMALRSIPTLIYYCNISYSKL